MLDLPVILEIAFPLNSITVILSFNDCLFYFRIILCSSCMLFIFITFYLTSNTVAFMCFLLLSTQEVVLQAWFEFVPSYGMKHWEKSGHRKKTWIYINFYLLILVVASSPLD